MTRTREARLNYEGSPPFRCTLGELTTGAVDIVDFQENTHTGLAGAAKYCPLDYLEIVNLDPDNHLTLEFSPTEKVYVPERGIVEWKHPFVRVKITNSGTGTIASGKVQLTGRRLPLTADEAAQREAAKPLWQRILASI